MCGILGLLIKKNSKVKDIYNTLLKDLFILSESRGKEASGFASIKDNTLFIHKTPFTASKLIKSRVFREYFDSYTETDQDSFMTFGHSRLVTNGYEHFNRNNQPVTKNGVCVVHNGIIVNQEKIWESLAGEEKISDLDTELIPTIIGKNIYEGKNLKKAVYEFYSTIYGMTSTAMLFETINCLLLATNNGSIYYIINNSRDAFIFASEAFILQSLIRKNNLSEYLNPDDIRQLLPNSTVLVDLINLDTEFSDVNNNSNFSAVAKRDNKLSLKEIEGDFDDGDIHINTSFEYSDTTIPHDFIDTYKERKEKISKLKRCKKCILPETHPYIEFDKDGVCNYCNNYKKIDYKGQEKLSKLVSQFKRKDGKHDCLVPFSGGRDSSFAIHFLKEELGLNPLAFSYDWGMLTDLARRNQARICGKLGVEHILISADIRKKRDNIHKNVSAWLNNPHLGTIPLFMAGDKQFYYYTNLLMNQNNLNLSIMGENLLETTNFKSGFSGIKPTFNKVHTYSLSTKNTIKLILFYGKEYLLNPRYLNSSILDTFDAFKSFYIIKHNYTNIYSYIKWDEDVIRKTLIDEYDWETDPGTITTWRIGDGTAAFYNYIYYVVAGFTENDTFRSNQIREGILNREIALQKSIEENVPRWDSIKWYCNTIQIDFINTIKLINSIPKHYNKE